MQRATLNTPYILGYNLCSTYVKQRVDLVAGYKGDEVKDNFEKPYPHAVCRIKPISAFRFCFAQICRWKQK
jgi:hypothetical protein